MALGRVVAGGLVAAGFIACAVVTAGQPRARSGAPVGLPPPRSGGRAGRIPACRVSSLTLTTAWLRQGTELAGLLAVTTPVPQVCYIGGGMSTNPSLALLDAAGRPLPLQRAVRAYSHQAYFIILRRGRPARTLFVWTNWCRSTPAGVIVVLAPGDGPETLRARLRGASPPCTDRAKPSLLMNADLTGDETGQV